MFLAFSPEHVFRFKPTNKECCHWIDKFYKFW